MGAKSWNASVDNARKVLLGRDVVIVSDADEPGRQYAKAVFSSLNGIARSLIVVESKLGKDITDHFEAGGDLDSLEPWPSPNGPELQPPPPPENLNGSTPSATPGAFKFLRGDQVEIADRLLTLLQNKDRTILTGDESELFGYNPERGLHALVAREEQSLFVQGMAGSPVKGESKSLRIKLSDSNGARQFAYDRVAKLGYFSEAPPGLAFSNGFATVSPEGVTLSPHVPENRARFGYPFPFEQTAPAERFVSFLHDLFRDDDDKAEKIAALQEHLGASLAGLATTFQRCVICIGEGDEGKSTLAKIIATAFPPGSIESIPPQEWGQEYRRAMLAGKLLNTVAELPESDIISSEAFKAVVAGDPITGRRIRHDPFTFKPRAGHLFLANRLPGTPDQTRGFWRRFIVVRFNRSFTGDSARDPLIAEKIIAAEKAQLVSWALQGAVRILAQKGHTIPSSHEREMAVWCRSADQITAFMEDRVTPAPSGRGVPAGEAYRVYREWAELNGHRAVSSSKFAGRLRELGFAVKKTKISNVYPIHIAGCSLISMVGAVGLGGGPVEATDVASTGPSQGEFFKDPSGLN